MLYKDHQIGEVIESNLESTSVKSGLPKEVTLSLTPEGTSP